MSELRSPDLTRSPPRAALRSVVVVLSLLTAACAAKQTARVPVPRPFPGGPTPPVAQPPAATPPTASVPEPRPPGASPGPGVATPEPLLATALTLQGTPYRNGGSDPSGFDCSGFVQWVFAQNGMKLPREVKDQWKLGDDIDRDDIKPGDLVFFETVSRGPSHVGIALGGDQFVHAPSSTGVVRIERYSSSYWSRRWVGAKRVL